MGNFSDIFRLPPSRFEGRGRIDETGLDPGTISTWAEGNNAEPLPITKLPSIQIGEVRSVDLTSNTAIDTVAEVEAALYAINDTTYNSGDATVLTYTDTEGNAQTISYLYSADANSRPDDYPGPTNADDWTRINFAAFSVSRLVTGTGLHATSQVGTVDLRSDLIATQNGRNIDRDRDNNEPATTPTREDRVVGQLDFSETDFDVRREENVYYINTVDTSIAFIARDIDGDEIPANFVDTLRTIEVEAEGTDASVIRFLGANGLGPEYNFGGGRATENQQLLFQTTNVDVTRVLPETLRGGAYTTTLRATLNGVLRNTTTEESLVGVAGNSTDADTYQLTGEIRPNDGYEFIGTANAAGVVPVPDAANFDSGAQTFDGNSRTRTWAPDVAFTRTTRFVDYSFTDAITAPDGATHNFTVAGAVTRADGTVEPEVGDSLNNIRMEGVRGDSWSVTIGLNILNTNLYEIDPDSIPMVGGQPLATITDGVATLTPVTFTGNWIGDTDQTDVTQTLNVTGGIQLAIVVESVMLGEESTNDGNTMILLPLAIRGTGGQTFTIGFSQIDSGESYSVADNVVNPPAGGNFMFPAADPTADTNITTLNIMLQIPIVSDDGGQLSFTVTATTPVSGSSAEARIITSRFQEFRSGNLTVGISQRITTGTLDSGTGAFRFNITNNNEGPYDIELYEEDPSIVTVTGLTGTAALYNGTYTAFYAPDPNDEQFVSFTGFDPDAPSEIDDISYRYLAYRTNEDVVANRRYIWSRLDNMATRGGWHMSRTTATGNVWLYADMPTDVQNVDLDEVTSWQRVTGPASGIGTTTIPVAQSPTVTVPQPIAATENPVAAGIHDIGSIDIGPLPDGETPYWQRVIDNENNQAVHTTHRDYVDQNIPFQKNNPQTEFEGFNLMMIGTGGTVDIDIVNFIDEDGQQYGNSEIVTRFERTLGVTTTTFGGNPSYIANSNPPTARINHGTSNVFTNNIGGDQVTPWNYYFTARGVELLDPHPQEVIIAIVQESTAGNILWNGYNPDTGMSTVGPVDFPDLSVFSRCVLSQAYRRTDGSIVAVVENIIGNIFVQNSGVRTIGFQWREIDRSGLGADTSFTTVTDAIPANNNRYTRLLGNLASSRDLIGVNPLTTSFGMTSAGTNAPLWTAGSSYSIVPFIAYTGTGRDGRTVQGPRSVITIPTT